MPPPSFVYSGINITFPSYKETGNDSIRASGQSIDIDQARYFSAHLMMAAESGSLAAGFINATYADGSVDSNAILVPVWWYDYLFGGDIIFPFYYSETGVDYNKSMIYLVSTKLDPSKELVSLQLSEETTGIHIFSLSLWPSNSAGNTSVEVQMARSTQKWMGDDEKIQIIEAHIVNTGTTWVEGDDFVTVFVDSPGFQTVEPAIIKRLRPGDQVKVDIGVMATMEAGTIGNATVVVVGANSYATYDFQATFGVVQYEATFESVYTHESPGWYDDAKYGIFIHWGLYSLPAWGNSGSDETYAEWFVLTHPRTNFSNPTNKD